MMKFLRSFYLTLKELLARHQASSVVNVREDEPLSRFIFSQRHLSKNPPRVKAEAFMPRKGEVSVFRREGMSESQVWNIGSELENERKRTLHGRGDIIARSAMIIGLQVTPADPPTRHANIVNWPHDKAKQKLLALQLAEHAALLTRT
jgi:hypothetical protein